MVLDYVFHPMSADDLPLAHATAGFQNERIVDTPDGPALLMTRDAIAVQATIPLTMSRLPSI